MAQDLTRFKIYLVGHAHIDLAYRWRWNEVVHRVGPWTFKGVLDLMERDPELTFVQSQMALYEAMEVGYPAIFAGIKQRIAEGRWFAADGWCEYDHTMPCGESMIRQHLIGSDYARNHLGVEIAMAWAADAFSGHTNTLPSILAGCGIKYLLFGRGMPDDTPFFWWEGPDGSRVLAYTPVHGYGGPINEGLLDRLPQWEKWGTREVMMLYGRGDHGGGPRAADLDALAELRALPGAPEIVHADPLAFFRDVLGQRDNIPVYRGDLGNPAEYKPDEGNFSGSVSSEGRNKQHNRHAENLLLTAERFATISLYFQRKPCFDRVDFEEAWKLVLRHQFHDELPGTSRGRVFEDNARDYDYVEASMGATLEHALGEISSRVNTQGDEAPILVHNPLAWTRTEPVTVELRLTEQPRYLAVLDPAGAPVPTQVLAVRQEGHFWYAKVLFLAEDVPALGYRLFRGRANWGLPVAEASVRVASSRHGLVLESDELRACIAKATGRVTSLYDKRVGREALAGPANALQAIDEVAGKSSGWMMALTDRVGELVAPDSVALIESGPVRATVRVGYRYRDSYFEQEVSVVTGLPRLLCRFRADWYERDCALKVAFPVDVDAPRATFEQPFGYIEREPDGAELPGQNWVDVSSADMAGDVAGLSLLNDCRYGHDVKGNVLRMTLLRGIPDLDPLADVGHHELSYAVYPHGAIWRAQTTRQGFELNFPLLARQVMRRQGLVHEWGVRGELQALGPEFSFLHAGPENVVVTAVKPMHDDWAQFAPFLVRVYETAGEDTQAVLDFGHNIYSAEPTDHLERPLPENDITVHERRVTFPLHAHQIRTIKLEFVIASFGIHETGDEHYVEPVLPENVNRFEGE